MNVLIVGYGHIGKPLFEIVSKYHNAQWRDIAYKAIEQPIDVIHICIPFDIDFVNNVWNYCDAFKPQLTIIESTVPVGTTQKLWDAYSIVHSPIRGREADGMQECIKKHTKFIGAYTQAEAIMALKYYESIGINAVWLGSPEHTEAAKLWDCALRTIGISCWNEIERFCKHKNLNIAHITNFVRIGNEESEAELHRPVHYPGKIGGHCLIPNLEILISQFDSMMIEGALRANENVDEKICQRQ